MFVVGDVEPRVEGLVGEAAVGVAGAGVGVVCVGEQAQAVVEEGSASCMVLVMVGQPPVDVCESGADAVLVSFEGGQVDGVGEVRREEFVGFGFQACPVRGQVGYLLVAACHAFVERGIDLGGHVAVGGVADREVGIRVGDEASATATGTARRVQVVFLPARPEQT